METAGSQRDERALSREYSWVAPALAGIAGSVDGIGYLLLYHVFTSHMSGNTVALTMFVAIGDWPQAWRHFEPILPFFFGVVAGLTVMDVLGRTHIRRLFAAIAGIEAALLLAFYLLAKPPHQWMVVFPAGAMGVQNAMLRRVGHHRVRTTFVTGMLTNTAQGLTEAVLAALARDGHAQKKFRDFLFYGSIWLFFACGGIAGALIDQAYGSVALLLPVAALAGLIALDLHTPLAAANPDG